MDTDTDFPLVPDIETVTNTVPAILLDALREIQRQQRNDTIRRLCEKFMELGCLSSDRQYRFYAEKLIDDLVGEFFKCQFCLQVSLADAWKGDICQKCGKKYDALLAQDEEE